MLFSFCRIFGILSQNYLKFFHLNEQMLSKIIHEHKENKVPSFTSAASFTGHISGPRQT